MSFRYILWSSVISLQLFGEVESAPELFLSFCLAGAEALVCIDDEEEVVQVKAQQVISITETLALNEICH